MRINFLFHKNSSAFRIVSGKIFLDDGKEINWLLSVVIKNIILHLLAALNFM